MIGKALLIAAGTVSGMLIEAKFHVVGWTTKKVKSLLKKEETTEAKNKK